MKLRIKSLLFIAGSVLALGTLGAWHSVFAEPDEHAKAPAKDAHQPPATAPHEEEPGETNPDAAHEDGAATPHDPHDADAHDPHDAHQGAEPAAKPAAKAPANGKPAKPAAGKPGDPTGRKPLFADKNSGKDAKAAPETGDALTADRALELLKEGNQRWASGETKNPNADAGRREMTAEKGQKPFVTILTCADSRIPVERVFDRGVGEIFTVRVAGNIAATAEVGTIEYGVEHLNTPLLIVMGHTKCGAVAAAASGQPMHGKVADLIAAIAPAVDRVKRANPGVDEQAIAAASVKENVWQSIFDLYKASDEIRQEAREGKVRVIGAIYDISTGKVEWLGEHPWQSQILDALATKTAGVESTSDSH